MVKSNTSFSASTKSGTPAEVSRENVSQDKVNTGSLKEISNNKEDAFRSASSIANRIAPSKISPVGALSAALLETVNGIGKKFRLSAKSSLDMVLVASTIGVRRINNIQSHRHLETYGKKLASGSILPIAAKSKRIIASSENLVAENAVKLESVARKVRSAKLTHTLSFAVTNSAGEISDIVTRLHQKAIKTATQISSQFTDILAGSLHKTFSDSSAGLMTRIANTVTEAGTMLENIGRNMHRDGTTNISHSTRNNTS